MPLQRWIDQETIISRCAKVPLCTFTLPGHQGSGPPAYSLEHACEASGVSGGDRFGHGPPGCISERTAAYTHGHSSRRDLAAYPLDRMLPCSTCLYVSSNVDADTTGGPGDRIALIGSLLVSQRTTNAEEA
jgi:hypothetical protein